VIFGTKSSRLDLDRMIERIRAGGADLVVTAFLSRLGRFQSHLIQILEELKNQSIRYISLNDGIDTDISMGRSFMVSSPPWANLNENISRRGPPQGSLVKRED
jgi:DNA invertase Pin-like site-specific DNA recombinase